MLYLDVKQKSSSKQREKVSLMLKHHAQHTRIYMRERNWENRNASVSEKERAEREFSGTCFEFFFYPFFFFVPFFLSFHIYKKNIFFCVMLLTVASTSSSHSIVYAFSHLWIVVAARSFLLTEIKKSKKIFLAKKKLKKKI